MFRSINMSEKVSITHKTKRKTNNSTVKGFELKYAWIFRYPLIFVLTLYLKLKNRKLNTTTEYLKHQKEFFRFTIHNDKSDKFHQIREKIAQYAFNGKNKKCIDIGTGYGYQAVALKKAGVKKVVGIDIVPERIEHAKKISKERITFQVMDAMKLQYPNRYFDCATVSAVLHDMPTDTKRKVIAEIVRVTKDRVVIFEPRTFKNPFIAFIYGTIGSILDESLNFKEYVKDDFEKLLKDNNFEIIKDENVWHNIMNIKVCKVK